MSSNDLEYAVVQFLDDDPSVAAIHKSWKKNVDGVLHCWWPKTDPNSKAKRKKPPKHNNNWRLYRIMIRYTTDDWDSARKRVQDAAETSNLATTSSDEMDEKRKRKRLPTKRYLDGARSDECRGEITREKTTNQSLPLQEISLPTKRKQPCHDSGNASVPSSSGGDDASSSIELLTEPDLEPRSQLQLTDATDYSSFGTPSKDGPCTSTPSKPDNSMSSSTYTHCDGLAELKKGQANLEKMQLQLIQGQAKLLDLVGSMHSNGGAKKVTVIDPILLDDLIEEPFQNAIQLENFEKELQQDKSKRSQLLSALKGVGNGNLGLCIRTMMTAIATKGVWQLYSFVGQKGRNGQKRGFKQMILYKIIRRACKSIHKCAADNEIGQIAGKFLSNSPYGCGGSRFKGGNKENEKSSSNLVSGASDTSDSDV